MVFINIKTYTSAAFLMLQNMPVLVHKMMDLMVWKCSIPIKPVENS